MLLNACKDIGLVINTRKTKCIEIGCHWCMVENEHISIGSNSCEKVKFKYLGSILASELHSLVSKI